ncbi:MAG: GntR family transcriptional regulator [Alkaliphilus sp.]
MKQISKQISKQNPVPLYYQLKEIIQEMIENEKLNPGDLVYPERELCEIYGISRMTARKAIMALVNEGVLYREQGRGTFVSEPKIKHQLSQLKGFTEEMSEKGLKTNTRILSFEVKEATKKTKKHLYMDETNNKVIEIRRLRIVEDVPFAIEIVWIPSDMCFDLQEDKLEGKSLYKIFEEQYGYTLDYAKQTIEPIVLNEYESDLLNLETKSLALLFRRKTYLDDGRVVEYTKAIYRSDKYKYEVLLKA